MTLKEILERVKEGTLTLEDAFRNVNIEVIDPLIAKKNRQHLDTIESLKSDKEKLSTTLSEKEEAMKGFKDTLAQKDEEVKTLTTDWEAKVKELTTTKETMEKELAEKTEKLTPYIQKEEIAARAELFKGIVNPAMVEDAYKLASDRFKEDMTPEQKKAAMTEFVKEKAYFSIVEQTPKKDDIDKKDDKPIISTDRHAGLRAA